MHDLQLLVADPDPAAVARLVPLLRTHARCIFTATTAVEALAILAEHPISVLLTELRLGDTSGLSLFWQGRQRLPDLRWIVVAGRATLIDPIEAFRQGAADFVLKPVNRSAIDAALMRSAGPQVNRDLPPADLKSSPPEQAAEGLAAHGSLKEIERKVVEQTLHRLDGNKTAAARTLGIHRKTLYRLLAESPVKDVGNVNN